MLGVGSLNHPKLRPDAPATLKFRVVEKGENFKLAASGEKGKKEKRKKGEALRIFPRVPRVGAAVVERRRRAAGA